MAVRIGFLNVEEVANRCGTSISFIEQLAQFELIHLERDPGGEPLLSLEDAERVRLGVLLIDELEVNLAGVEVILHMRESIVSMQRQFAELLACLARETKQDAER